MCNVRIRNQMRIILGLVRNLKSWNIVYSFRHARYATHRSSAGSAQSKDSHQITLSSTLNQFNQMPTAATPVEDSHQITLPTTTNQTKSGSRGLRSGRRLLTAGAEVSKPGKHPSNPADARRQDEPKADEMRRQRRLGKKRAKGEERTWEGNGRAVLTSVRVRVFFWSPRILDIGGIFFFWSHSIMSTIKPNTLYTGTERLHTTILSNQTLP
jgi:hypothetical protein